MPAYEAESFEPPAPVARVLVRTTSGPGEVETSMLVDTGADTTVVPREVVERLGAPVRPSRVLLQMFDGTEQEGELADLRLELLRYRFRGAFVVVDAAYGVLGRDILNLLSINLDGPRQEWSA